jgi:hypothetical protein
MAPNDEVRVNEFRFFVSWWTALVPGTVTAAVTLVVLVVRAAVEGRAATLADVVSALAVGLIVGVVGAVVPWLMVRRMARHAQADGPSAHFSWSTHGTFEPPYPHPDSVAPGPRFDKFDDAARNVLTNAQREATRLAHNYIGTEHLLLGIVAETDSPASALLRGRGVDLEKTRTAVGFIIGRGTEHVSGEVGLTPRAKRVIELGIAEAREMGDHFIGSEHLLLGLLREGEGIAAGVLESFGVDPERLRSDVLRLRSSEENGPEK